MQIRAAALLYDHWLANCNHTSLSATINETKTIIRGRRVEASHRHCGGLTGLLTMPRPLKLRTEGTTFCNTLTTLASIFSSSGLLYKQNHPEHQIQLKIERLTCEIERFHKMQLRPPKQYVYRRLINCLYRG